MARNLSARYYAWHEIEHESICAQAREMSYLFNKDLFVIVMEIIVCCELIVESRKDFRNGSIN